MIKCLIFLNTGNISIMTYIYHKYIVMALIALKNNEIPRRLRLICIHSYWVLLEAVGWSTSYIFQKIKHNSIRQFIFRMAHLLLLLREHCRGAKQWGAHLDEVSENFQRGGGATPSDTKWHILAESNSTEIDYIPLVLDLHAMLDKVSDLHLHCFRADTLYNLYNFILIWKENEKVLTLTFFYARKRW